MLYTIRLVHAGSLGTLEKINSQKHFMGVTHELDAVRECPYKGTFMSWNLGFLAIITQSPVRNNASPVKYILKVALPPEPQCITRVHMASWLCHCTKQLQNQPTMIHICDC